MDIKTNYTIDSEFYTAANLGKIMAQKKIMTSLIAINAIGLMALAAITFTSDVTGQNIVRADRYTAVVGQSRSRLHNEILYIIDSNSNRMVAVEFDPTDRIITVVGSRDINRDLKEISRNKSNKKARQIMNNRNTILCLTASAFVVVALLVIQIESRYTRVASAGNVITNEHSTLLTAKIGQEDDGIFQIDNNTGYIVLYRYDEDIQKITMLAKRDLRTLFSSNTKGKIKDKLRRRARER